MGGLYGGWISLLASLSQSMCLKNMCSTKSPLWKPSRFLGSLQSSYNVEYKIFPLGFNNNTLLLEQFFWATIYGNTATKTFCGNISLQYFTTIPCDNIVCQYFASNKYNTSTALHLSDKFSMCSCLSQCHSCFPSPLYLITNSLPPVNIYRKTPVKKRVQFH